MFFCKITYLFAFKHAKIYHKTSKFRKVSYFLYRRLAKYCINNFGINMYTDTYSIVVIDL